MHILMDLPSRLRIVGSSKTLKVEEFSLQSSSSS